MRRPSVIAAIALAIIIVGAALSTRTMAEGLEDGLTVVAVDQGAAPAQADLDIVETALGAISPSLTAGGVGLISYGKQPGQFTLLRPGPDTMLAVKAEVARLRSTVGPYKSGQFELLSAAYANMTRLNAPRGSRLVMVTTGRIEGESEGTPARLQSMGELYAKDGWQIDVLTVPSTEPAIRELMHQLAAASGGSYYDLGSPDGMAALLGDWQGLRLSPAIDAELHAAAPSITSVDVAPKTASLRVAFMRQDSRTAVQLFRPNGAPVDLNIPGNSRLDLPNVVVFSIDNPAPGAWRLQGIGAPSRLVAGVDIRNPLTVIIVEEPPFPLGEEAVLRAQAVIDGIPQVLPGAVVTARVQWADGAATVYELNDAGAGADQVAGDGAFSVALPAATVQGYNDVALELSWADNRAVLRGSSVFRTENFPVLQVTRLDDIKSHSGQQASVATIRAMVGSYPYLVRAEDISAVMKGADGSSTVAAVTPKAIIEDGKAWEFDVTAALPASGEYALDVAIRSQHLGRQFEAPAPGMSTSAVITPAPLRLLGLPVWAWAVIGVSVLVLGLAAIYATRQVRPYGFLYDDQDRLVADFSRVTGGISRRLWSRNRVPASEIPGLPFHGGQFAFGKEGVELHYQHQPGDPSIRVNSHPAAGPIIRLTEDVWLGVGGRLLRFVSRRGNAMAPAPGDGN
jgi:hypothetical protein